MIIFALFLTLALCTTNSVLTPENLIIVASNPDSLNYIEQQIILDTFETKFNNISRIPQILSYWHSTSTSNSLYLPLPTPSEFEQKLLSEICLQNTTCKEIISKTWLEVLKTCLDSQTNSISKYEVLFDIMPDTEFSKPERLASIIEWYSSTTLGVFLIDNVNTYIANIKLGVLRNKVYEYITQGIVFCENQGQNLLKAFECVDLVVGCLGRKESDDRKREYVSILRGELVRESLGKLISTSRVDEDERAVKRVKRA